MHHRGFFHSLKENLGKGGVIYGAFREAVVSGVSVEIKSRERGEVSYVGVDRHIAANDHSYFNLSYNAPIADAIATGMKQLSFGRHLYDLKMKRGCRLIQTVTSFKPGGTLQGLLAAGWFRILEQWNRGLSPSENGTPYSKRPQPDRPQAAT